MKKGVALKSFLPWNSIFPPLSGHNTCVFIVHVSDATSTQRRPPQVDIRALPTPQQIQNIFQDHK